MTFEELFQAYAGAVSEALTDAFEIIGAHAIVGLVAGHIARRNAGAAIEALQIQPEHFSTLEEVLRDAFLQGGKSLVNGLPAVRRANGPAVIWQFSTRNLQAEAFLKDHSSGLITGIIDDQKSMVRGALERGLAAGVNPTTAALDIVGRVNKSTGKRSGGILGLTTRQEEWQRSYEEDLRSGSPERLKEALGRGLRDKRFDRSVKKAIREGKPIPAATIAKMVTSYRNKSLKYRADMIGRSETMRALSESRHNALQQQIQAGKISARHITKVWDAVGDRRTRDAHKLMEGQAVGFDELFTSPTGATLRYPHDPNAPASDTIACRCRLKYDIDFIGAGLERRRG